MRLSQMMTHDGSPFGSPELAVNGSLTPQEFFFRPDSDAYIDQLSLYIQDGTNVVFDAETFGSLGELNNGLYLELREKEDPFTIEDVFFIHLKSVADMWNYSSRVEIHHANKAVLRFSLGFPKGLVTVSPSQELRLIVSDDLSGLVKMNLLVTGAIE